MRANLLAFVCSFNLRHDQLCIEKQEKSIWQKRHYTIIKKISEYQCREKDFRKVLEKLQSQQIESKKNFQEKTSLLHEARKRVFYLENTLLALEKERTEKESELDPQIYNFMTHIIQMQEVQYELEFEIRLLEEIICNVYKPKKKIPVQKKQPKASKENGTSIRLQKKISELSANQLSRSHTPFL